MTIMNIRCWRKNKTPKEKKDMQGQMLPTEDTKKPNDTKKRIVVFHNRK